MDKEFFKKSEKECWDNLVKFQEKYHVFNDIERINEDKTEGKHHSDASGYTTNKLGERRNFNIELKNRNQILLENGSVSGTNENGGGYTGDTIMIESHKVADLLLDNIIGLEPLYVNFLLDGSILVFNLNKLTKRPKKSDTMNIKSRGYNKFEMAKRQYLYIIDAAVYKNGKLIKRAGEDFI